MALSNGNSDRNNIFVNFNSKEALFVIGTKENRQTYKQLRDVTLTRVAVKDDEYEGQPVRKLQLTLDEGKDRYITTFNLSVNAVCQLVAKLVKADLAKPLGLTAELRKAGSTYKRGDGTLSEPLARDMANLSVWQDAYLNLQDGEYPPKVEKVTVGKKEVSDDSARSEWVEQKVAELAAKVAAIHGSGSGSGSSDDGFQEPPKGAGKFDDLGEDIPF